MTKGRPTTDPKRNVLRIRLNEDMRVWLDKKSIQTGDSLSQVIRDIIQKEMKNS